MRRGCESKMQLLWRLPSTLVTYIDQRTHTRHAATDGSSLHSVCSSLIFFFGDSGNKAFASEVGGLGMTQDLQQTTDLQLLEDPIIATMGATALGGGRTGRKGARWVGEGEHIS